MPKKPEPKFTVIYSDKPLDLPEEEMKRSYDEFVKFLVELYKSVAEEKRLGMNNYVSVSKRS